MPCVQDDLEATTVEELAEAAAVLEDTGEARRLEQVDFAHHAQPYLEACPRLPVLPET